MKKHLLFVLLISCLYHHTSTAQVTLTSSPYTQNFNTIGSGLPTGWTVNTGATATSIGSSVTLTTAATAWANTGGTFKNFAAYSAGNSTWNATQQSAAADRALGLRQTGAFADVGGAFVLQLANTAGLSNFNLSFKLQSLDPSSTRTATWVVDYGIETTPSTPPSTFTAVTTIPTPITTSGAFSSTDVNVSFGNALDNKSGNVWIRIATLTGTTGSGNRPSSAIDDVNITFNLSDVVPPVFASNYPAASALTTTGFTLLTSINEPGKTYFVIVPDGDASPTTGQIISGQDASGTPVAPGFSGTINNTAALTEYNSVISTLTTNTSYDVYVVAEDVIPNLQTSSVKLDITTLDASDVTPPDFFAFYPDATAIASTSFTLRTGLTELGKTYYVVLPDNAAAPTSAQVKSGTDASNSTVTLKGSVIVSAISTEYTVPVTGLSAATSYDVYVVGEDRLPNLQTSPVKIDITTQITPYTENFNACISDVSSFSRVSVSGVHVWDCTTFGNNSTNGVQINGGFSTGSTPNEDWLISPQLTLGNNASVTFDNKKVFQGLDISLKISINYAGTDPTTASWNDLPFVKSPVVLPGGAFVSSGTVDLSAYAGLKAYIAIIYTSGSTVNTGAQWTIDNFIAADAVPSYLITSVNKVSDFGYVAFPNVSAAKSFTIQGQGITADLTATAPPNFELSKDGNTFSGSVVFTPAEIVSIQTLYVRFKPTAAGIGFLNSTIEFASGTFLKGVKVSGVEGIDARASTFDVTTYNLEFFGTDAKDGPPPGGAEFGPTNDALQIANVTSVFEALGSDIYGVEEVADDAAFNQLVANLPGYAGILSPRWSYSFNPPDQYFPPQKVGFIYNTSTVQIVSSRAMFSKLYDDILANTVTLPSYPGGTSSSFWSSGRLPFMIKADVTINGITNRVHFVVIHSKSGSAAADYNRRVYDVQVLHDSLTAHYANEKVILVGDYNDDVDGSIYTGHDSSYKVFVDDAANYNALTFALTQTSASTFPSSNSFLDHIIISDDLTSSYNANSIFIEDPSAYIASYSSTTSDHLPVTARFTLSKANQTITFDPLPDQSAGDAPIILTGFSSSGLPVTYVSSNTAVATVTGNLLTIVGEGSTIITASQAGNASYNPAADMPQSLIVNKGNQTITFNGLANQAFGDAPFVLAGFSSSGLALIYSSSNTLVATISGSTVTIVGPGNTTITASQPGNSNFNAATPVDQPLTVSFGSQTITFNSLPAKTFGDTPFTLTATASSGLQVSYESSNTAVATISGSTVTIVGAGNTTITAKQSGSAIGWNSAPDVPQPLAVSLASQTITFNPLPAKLLADAPFTLTATASSGLSVSYVSSNTAVATISGNSVTIVGVGNTTITASQAGDSNFTAATPVDQPLTVSLLPSQTITFNPLPSKVFGDAPFTLAATASSGLPVSYSSSNTAVATISGSTVTIVGVGNTTITASQSGSAGYSPATDVLQQLVVTLQSQTITFAAIADRTLGDPAFGLGATASSALPVSYTSANDKITLAGSSVTIVKAGRATITASQAGNANISAATPINRSFCINPVKPIVSSANLNTETPVLTSNAANGNQWYKNGTIIGGATNATFTVTGPGIYKVQVAVDDCLSAFSSDIPIIITGDIASTRVLIAYPNPATSYIEVSGLVGEIGSSQLIDVLGKTSQILLQRNADVYRGNVEDLSPGIYFLRIQEGTSVHQIKFVKK